MNPFASIDTLGWILIAVVVVSLVISVVALIIQLMRKKSQKKQSMPGAGAHQHPHAAPPFAPQQQWQQPQPQPQQQPQYPPAFTPQQQSWPTLPEDYNDQTVSLFTGNPQQSNMPEYTAQVRYDSYRVSIREISPEGARNFDITVDGEFNIGRLPSNHLQLANTTVSGVHCTLTVGQDCIYIANRSTSNITLLNGAKLADMRPIKPGDTLHLGKVQILIMDINKNAAY